MKVCILGPSLAAVSGVSTHLNQLFSSSLAQRYTLLHFQVGSEGRKETAYGKLYRLLSGPIVFFFYFLIRHRPDIVHLNTSLDQKSYWRDLVFMLIAHALGKKIVFQKHGGPLPALFFPNNKVLTGLLQRVLRLPDAIVVLGHEEYDAYRSFVPGQRVVEIANAIEAEALTTRSLEAETTGRLHLVYVGRLAENKGIFDALEACARLLEQGHDVRFTFAGGGPDETRLKDRVCSLGLHERVRLAGPLFGVEKDALWRSADVFVFPTYHEGLPYALLEAMVAGAVPVTTRVGAIPDVVQDGVHGLFVPPKDVESIIRAIARLDADRSQLSSMARAGRARVLAHYSVVRLAADFGRLYAGLAETTA